MEKFERPFGHVETLAGTKEVEVAIVVINLGKEAKPHFHKKTKEIEIILDGEGLCNDRPCKKGDMHVWNFGDVHSYKNTGSTDLRILCITIPPYDPEDVFEVS